MRLNFLFLGLLLSTISYSQGNETSSIATQIDSLTSISNAHVKSRNWEKAVEASSSALQLAKDSYGRESKQYAECCYMLGLIYFNTRDLVNVEKWWLDAKLIREMVLSDEDPELARSLNDLGGLYLMQGKFEQGRLFLHQAKDIRKKLKGQHRRDYAGTLINLAVVYREIGQYKDSEDLFLEARQLFESGELDRDDGFYINCLGNLAILYSEEALYELAEPLMVQSVELQGKKLGKQHLNYSTALSNLAILYIYLGKYNKAELCIREANQIKLENLGSEHIEYSVGLGNLGNLYFALGNYRRALEIYIKVKEIHEKNAADHTAHYAKNTQNMAACYENLGEFGTSNIYYQQSLELKRELLGKNHLDYASTLSNAGRNYMSDMEYAKSKEYFLESMEIRSENIGTDNAIYAKSLDEVGTINRLLGETDNVEKFYLEAKEIRERTLGKQHPDYANSLSNLAAIYELQNRYKEADLMLEELFAIERKAVLNAIQFLSEKELNEYISTFETRSYQLASYLLDRSRSQPISEMERICQISYDHAIFYKGFLLNTTTRLSKLSRNSPEAEDISNRLKGVHRSLAVEYAKPINERTDVKELESRSMELEKKLTRLLSNQSFDFQDISWKDIQQALQPGEMAIEFIHFQVEFPKPEDRVAYAALVLLPEYSSPQFIYLCDESELLAVLNYGSQGKPKQISRLYGLSNRGLVPQMQAVSAKDDTELEDTLFKLIWEKIDSLHVRGISKIFFCPSGVLNRVNLSALSSGESRPMALEYEMLQVSSTRRLISSNVEFDSSDSLSAALFGGISFTMDFESQLDSIVTNMTDQYVALDKNTDVQGSLMGEVWNELDWTLREVKSIELLFQENAMNCHVYTGELATESAFKQLATVQDGSPSVIHLATHGFFFSKPDVNLPVDSTRYGFVYRYSSNPMIRSGLVLSGGNYVWEFANPYQPDMEDGILTAYEISHLDLSNTDVVVLSACETGLGDIHGSEGVYGLQRAFRMAGVKYLVMSLWQVPDRETMIFMTKFYTNWLQKKQSIPDAFRSTQSEMSMLYSDPYSWAGFVLVE